MAEQKHTPGPWVFNGPSVTNGDPTLNGGRYNIASVYGFMDDDDGEANARLIAASPDLYEALKEYKLGYTDAELKQLAETKSGRGEISPDVAAREIRRRAALARVEGEGE